ncbi:MAG: extracellular solute-binding protein [Firmicutes bacterium]|nr:extracellular solute-binding protein [Bacillota bacterium]
MKKIISIFAAFVIFASTFLLTGCSLFTNRSDTLKILNFADYIDTSLLDDFKEYYEEKYDKNLRIVYDTVNTNENMYTKIAKGKEDWDLVCMSDYMIQRMQREELLQKLDFDIIEENYNNISPFIQDSFYTLQGIEHGTEPEDANLYSVCYMWGTMGILYNTDYVDEDDVLHWSILWNEDYAGKIYMKDAVRDTVVAAILYLRQHEFLSEDLKIEDFDDFEKRTARQELFNDVDADFVKAIEEVLKQQKKELSAKYDIDFDKDEMARGAAYLNVAWSGDVSWAIEVAYENDVNLAYSIPLEGSNLWFDGWCIPKYAKNTTAANEFINFLLDIDNAISNMEETGYTSCVASEEVLEWAIDYWAEISEYYDEELYGDYEIDVSYFFGDIEGADAVSVSPIMYTPSYDMARCMIMNDYTPENNDLMLKMWTQVKGGIPEYVYFALGAALAVTAALIIYFIIKNKRTNKKI